MKKLATALGVLLLADNLLQDPSPYRITLVDSVRAITARHPEIRQAHFAGTTVVNAELNRSAGKDAILFYTLVTLLVLVVGYLSLRTVALASDLVVTKKARVIGTT